MIKSLYFTQGVEYMGIIMIYLYILSEKHDAYLQIDSVSRGTNQASLFRQRSDFIENHEKKPLFSGFGNFCQKKF